MHLAPALDVMVRDKVATGLYSSAGEVVSEALHPMEEQDRFNKMKLGQLRADIEAGIASSDAGTLDAEEIKRRGRARLAPLALCHCASRSTLAARLTPVHEGNSEEAVGLITSGALTDAVAKLEK